MDQALSGTGGRSRGDRPVAGVAAPRELLRGDLVAFPFFGPWGQWYPWFTGGFGWNAGFFGYNPWSYGATCWNWGRYGAWYDPYSYCWDPLWSDPGYGSGSSGRTPAAGKPPDTMGSIRLKANVVTAKVYIDNALAGTVEEFNGLNNHLEIAGGRHAIELRAEGYQPSTKEIEVVAGKTQTVRISMKKK